MSVVPLADSLRNELLALREFSMSGAQIAGNHVRRPALVKYRYNLCIRV